MDNALVEVQSFIVRFFVRDGRTVARITNATSTQTWVVANADALQSLQRAVRHPSLSDKEFS
ncbi:MAG: hypothetical protein M3N19_00040 [Candidatus Eremiobacteraeota bacterium]|nr:hypothetical protein [Candidatus Eremiobacteraeota bacterium]